MPSKSSEPCATLAFCNDIDFASWETYREAHHVLEEEFGFPAEDSFWLFDPRGSDLALFVDSIDKKGPRHDDLLTEIAAGRLTILHGGGNFSLSNTDVRATRSLIDEGLAYLDEKVRVPVIWTNHGDEGDLTNLGGAQPRYQEGDMPASQAFVVDLLQQHGVRFFGLDHHSLRNQFTFSREIDAPNALLTKEVCRSGHTLTCFRRFRGDLPKAPDAITLGWQLRPAHLEELEKRGGTTVIYQHWCVHRDQTGHPYTAHSPVFPSETVSAFQGLAKRVAAGSVRVAALSNLLFEVAAVNDTSLACEEVR